MGAQPGVTERGQRMRRHRWTEVGTTDPDIDDVGDLVVGPDSIGERSHSIKDRVNARYDVGAIDDDNRTLRCPQCCVKHRSTFGDIDPRPGEHLIASRQNTGRHCVIDERPQQGIVDRLLREIDPKVTSFDDVPVGAPRVFGKQFGERTVN